MTDVVVLRCCHCGLPWAKVQAGVLIIESKHHGDKHVNVIPLADLLRMCHNEPDSRTDNLRTMGMGTA